MSEQCKVGEIVIGIGFLHDTHLNGMEGVIMNVQGYDRLQLSNGLRQAEGFWYGIKWASGERTSARSVRLRRKRPPRRECDEVVRWDDCAWKPRHKEAA